MDELVYLENEEAVCSSLDVASHFGKQHGHVIRSIEEIKKNSSVQNWTQSFREVSYKDKSGKTNKMYLMNRDGFSFLVMGFTGKKANDWKWQYIRIRGLYHNKEGRWKFIVLRIFQRMNSLISTGI